ncbi:MAG: ABC transporter substrate-binding protein [Bacillus sp. (in: firmicutes)]
MFKKWHLLLSLLVIIFLTACGSEESNGENKPLKLGFSALPSWYLWHLVEEKGFFEKNGVEVELVYFPVYADSLSALNTGEIDGNSQALIDTIAPLENGIPLKPVFITDNSNGGDGLVATKDIQTVADLKGKKVGTEIGTIEHFFMLTALEQAGLSEKDVEFTNMAVQDAGTTFIAGNLDAAGLWEPFLSKAETEGEGHKLITSAEFPGLIADLFVVREEIAEEREEDIQNITAAWFEAVEYFKGNEEESLQIIADAAGITVEELAVGMEGFDLFTVEQNMKAMEKGESYESIHYTADKNSEFLNKLGFIDENPDFNHVFTSAFIENELNKD